MRRMFSEKQIRAITGNNQYTKLLAELKFGPHATQLALPSNVLGKKVRIVISNVADFIMDLPQDPYYGVRPVSPICFCEFTEEGSHAQYGGYIIFAPYNNYPGDDVRLSVDRLTDVPPEYHFDISKETVKIYGEE